MEYNILWQCPKCKNYQNKSIRFKNDEDVNDRKIVEKKRKNKYKCIYCGFEAKFEQLPFQKTINPENSQISGKLNKENITFLDGDDEDFKNL